MAVLDTSQFEQLVQQVKEALMADSQGVGEIEIVTSLANLVSLPALRLIGATETVVEAPLELLSAPAVEAAAKAIEATDRAVVAAVNAEAAADLADAESRDLGELKEQTISAGNEASAKGDKALAEAMNAGEATVQAMLIVALMQEKLEQAQVIILDGKENQALINELTLQVADTIIVCATTREDADAAILSLRELQAQVADIIRAAYDSLDEMQLAALNTVRATEKANTSAAGADAAAEGANKAKEDALKVNQDVVAAEVKRIAAESSRVTEEGKRVNTEGKRVTEESKRVSEENKRSTSETGRAAAETTRATKETERKTAESLRVTEEGKRVTEEGKRVTAEKSRVTETAQVISNTDTAKSNAQSAANRANTISDNPPKIVNGVWHKYNEVTKEYVSTGLQAKGDTGSSFKVIGNYLTLKALKAAVPDGTDVDGVYGIGSEPPYVYHSWSYKDGVWGWTEQGALEGQRGESAYQAAVRMGYEGTEEEYATNPITNAELARLAAVKAGADVAEFIKTAETAIEKLVTDTEKEVGDFVEATGETVTAVVNRSNTLSDNPQKIVDGVWQKYDEEAKAYISTGVRAAPIDWLVRDLDRIPEENDVTYRDETTGLDVQYPIGAEVRVADSESDQGYKFYKLYDLTDGIAVWAEGGGGGGDLREKVTINLTTNQTKPDNAIIGVTVTVTDITLDTIVYQGAWNGKDILAKVTALSTYTVKVSEIEGYATPQIQSYEATIQGERLVTMTYNACLLTVSLDSNQSNKADIASAKVTVSYADKNIGVVSGGSVKVPIGEEITVTASPVTDYATPVTQIFIAATASKELAMAYNACVLTVSLLSNQTDLTDIAGAKVTIKSGGVSSELSSGDIIKVPFGIPATVTASAVDGYKVDSTVTFTPDTVSKALSFLYQTEVVTVTVSADNGADMSGQTITLTNQGTQAVIATATNTLTKKIPFGTQVAVSVDDKNGYNTPAPQTFTASQMSRTIPLQYVYNPIEYSYIILDQGITDPATMLSGDINGSAIRLIRNNSHRVLGKYTADGQMTVCRLNDDNGNQYHDGTTAVLTGSEGDAFMRLPQFYYKAVEQSADVWKIGFAYGGQPDETWKEWDGDDLIGVYEAYNSGSKAYSRSGVASTGRISQAGFKSYARNRGNGYTIVKHKHQNIMAFLYYSQYGHTNCQAKIGVGTNDYAKATGQTNALGMEDTKALTNGNSQSINFWGLENWWGNKYEWEDNVTVDGRVWKVTEDDGTVRTCPMAYTSDGYIKKLQVGDYLDTICKEAEGSDTTGFCDYYQQTSSSSRVVLRSFSNSYPYGGVAYAHASFGSSSSYSSFGSRLAFRGDIVEAESVAAFKAIAVSN